MEFYARSQSFSFKYIYSDGSVFLFIIGLFSGAVAILGFFAHFIA